MNGLTVVKVKQSKQTAAGNLAQFTLIQSISIFNECT